MSIDSLEDRTLLSISSGFTTIAPPGQTVSDLSGVTRSYIVGTANGGPFLYNITTSTYTTIDPPGSVSSVPTGISGTNVVGRYNSSNTNHDFLYNITTSTYTTLAPPGLVPSYATPAISGSNVVGMYQDSSYTDHGFVYNITTSTYTTIDPPGSLETQATAISGANVVGNYLTDTYSTDGFLYNIATSTYTTFNPLGSLGAFPSGISGNNAVGNYNSSAGSFGFVYNITTSAYTTIDPPGSTLALVNGVSGSNVVGSYDDTSFGQHGFLYNIQTNTYTTLDPPGGGTFNGEPSTEATAAFGGTVVGDDINGGFLYEADDFQLIEATESNPSNLLLTYNVSASDLSQPITLEVFRSASPDSYDASSPLTTVEITNPAALQQGQQQVELNLNGAILNINPSEEYVDVIANPVNGQTTDPNDQVCFQKLVLGVVTYGFELPLVGAPPEWAGQIASGLMTADGYNDAIEFDWSGTGSATAAGDSMAALIVADADNLVNAAGVDPGSVVDLNLIGHSRGAVVVSQAMQELASTDDPALEGSFKEMTLLDPHPANIGDQSISYSPRNPLSWPAVAEYDSIVALVQDPKVVIPANANQVVVYYQQTLYSAFPLLSLESNLNLQGDLAEIVNNSNVPITLEPALTGATLQDGSVVGHSEVPYWYLQNVVLPDLFPQVDPPPQPQNSVDPLGPPPAASAVQAFLYPQFVTDATTAQTLADEFATACGISLSGECDRCDQQFSVVRHFGCGRCRRDDLANGREVVDIPSRRIGQ